MLTARDGDPAAIDEMRRAIDVLRTTARLRLPYYQGLLAVACGWEERYEEGLATIAAAFEDTRATGERWWEAELHRIRGELLASSDATEATHCFRTAIEIARSQGAKSLELKAVASLSALRPRRTRSF